jgi:hypothetical protein
MFNSILYTIVLVLCLFTASSGFTADKIEPYARDWQLRVDNDAIAPGSRDRNYTGGITFSQSGRRAAERAYSLDGWLGYIDSLFNFGTDTKLKYGHNMQAGLLTFTPEQVSIKEPIFDDHPYSNLIFLANSRQRLSDDNNSVTRSMLLVGLFGTNSANTIQAGLHKLVEAEEAKGWHNQISDGGEPTLRYSLSRTDLVKTHYDNNFTSYDISTTLEANVGYTTDINAGISLRFGRIHPLGWFSLPEPSDHFTGAYAPLLNQQGNGDTELFFLVGANLRLRAYNVLLQGQFRSSKVSYSYSDLNPLILEIWAGAGVTFSNGWQVSYVIRGRTKEFDADQSLRHVWGGLTVLKAL